MTEAEKRLAAIEQIMSDIEELDRGTDGKFRQAEDREAFDIAARIERMMIQKVNSAENVSRGTSNGDAA